MCSRFFLLAFAMLVLSMSDLTLGSDASGSRADMSNVSVALHLPAFPKIFGVEVEPIEGEPPVEHWWVFILRPLEALREIVSQSALPTQAQIKAKTWSRPLRRTRTDLFLPPLRFSRDGWDEPAPMRPF